MMILSQDNIAIANTDTLNYIKAEEIETNYRNYTYKIIGYYSDNKIILGEYKTDKRANEILQDIYKQMQVQNFSFTYEMPKEWECGI